MFSANLLEAFTHALDAWDNYVCLSPPETGFNAVMLVATVVAIAVTFPKIWLVAVFAFYHIQGPHGLFAFLKHHL